MLYPCHPCHVFVVQMPNLFLGGWSLTFSNGPKFCISHPTNSQFQIFANQTTKNWVVVWNIFGIFTPNLGADWNQSDLHIFWFNHQGFHVDLHPLSHDRSLLNNAGALCRCLARRQHCHVWRKFGFCMASGQAKGCADGTDDRWWMGRSGCNRDICRWGRWEDRIWLEPIRCWLRCLARRYKHFEWTRDLFNPQCGDLGDTEPMLNYLRFFLKNDTIRGCVDAAIYCKSLTSLPEYGIDDGKGWATRMLCSETCGCDTPAGENLLVQGCPYGSGRACQMSNDFRTFQENSVCVDKNASSLREFAPWVQWIQALQAYGEENSTTLLGQNEALAIAQAMWDHGCGFQANLSGQNISWGNCFAWNSSFGWDFKTLEVFCPLSCGCSVDTLDSGCPRPFGYSCDQLEENRCLLFNNQHYCPELSPGIIGIVTVSITATDPTVLGALVVPVQVALLESLAHFSGGTTQGTRLDLEPRGTIVLGQFTIFQIDPTWNLELMAANLFSTPLNDFETRVFQILASQGIQAATVGLDITSMGPSAPVPIRRLDEGNTRDLEISKSLV